MIKTTVTNKYGESLNLSAEPSLAVTQITGLTPAPATINTAGIATKDGSLFNSAFVQNRNIVLTIYPLNTIEAARVNLYRFFKVKQEITLAFETGSRAVEISGYVETVEGDLFANPQVLQVSIICPDPYFKAQEETTETFAVSESISNPSDDSTGAIIEINASGAAENPSITNATTGETFSITKELQAGDKITIDTRRGQKALTLTRDGETESILNDMDTSSKWISLTPGANALTLTAEEGAENLTATVRLRPIYEGL